ncbi:HAMP domain-containing protein [Candidatus Sumerlaeota bacterium]|nr:HAMP domain-containing protein [Candidatus Sumerlaeota bacterium]
MESRALEAASDLDQLLDKQSEELQKIVKNGGTDLKAAAAACALLGSVEVVARYRSPADFEVIPVRPRASNLVPMIRALGPEFENLIQLNNVYSDGYFEDRLLENEGGEPTPMLTAAYPAPEGGITIFFSRPEFFVQQVRSPLISQDESILLYSAEGHLLTHDGSPEGLAERARREFQKGMGNVTGQFNLRRRDAGHLTWHLITYTVSRRLSRLASEGAARSPWLVMISYDMESFLGPQSTLIWFAVVVSLIWALLLMAISIASGMRIVGPIKKLRKQAEAMASGDLTARAEVKTGDEIQDLAEAFNTMAEKLLASYERITKFNQELEQKVEARTADLAHANQKLVQTEKYAATGRLAANLAHEINNPLGIIKNYLHIVTLAMQRVGGGRRASDPNLDHVKIINEELDRIARIVRQLLDLHRPVEQRVVDTDINAMLRDILTLVEKGCSKGKIEIKTELEENLPHLMVSPDLIRQVCINLIQNAQDAMESKGGGGALTVKTRSQTAWDNGKYVKVVCISVTDTGGGIKPEDIGRIFDPFFTTKAADKGTGLGLSVSYGIVQMYCGSIEAFSEPGKGTTMMVSIPVDQAKREAKEDGQPITPPRERFSSPTESTELPILETK